MSLNIYLEGIDKLPDMPIMKDAHYMFNFCVLNGCGYDRDIFKLLEDGFFAWSNRCYIDSSGYKLYIDYLSVGTKLALSVYHMTDKVIWCGEVGDDVIVEIVRNCTRGNLLMPVGRVHIFDGIEDAKIDVICQGVKYDSFSAFAKFIVGCE